MPEEKTAGSHGGRLPRPKSNIANCKPKEKTMGTISYRNECSNCEAYEESDMVSPYDGLCRKRSPFVAVKRDDWCMEIITMEEKSTKDSP